MTTSRSAWSQAQSFLALSFLVPPVLGVKAPDAAVLGVFGSIGVALLLLLDEFGDPDAQAACGTVAGGAAGAVEAWDDASAAGGCGTDADASGAALDA